MSGPRTLSIGITVNLEHYENLRLEVSGEVRDQSDAQDLVRFLDEMLGSFGQGDPATAERIESYRKRVFPVSIPVSSRSAAAVSPGPVSSHSDAILEEDAAADRSDSPAESHPVTDTGAAAGAPAGPGGRKTASSGDADGGGACEDCGAAVNLAEQKMSRLFTSRTLCRKCMKKL